MADCIYRVIQKSPYIGINRIFRSVVGRSGPLQWPPRSPDLAPLDFYLRGHFRVMVYQLKIQNMDNLKESIRATCVRVTADVLKRVRLEWAGRIRVCYQCNSDHTQGTYPFLNHPV